MLPRQVYIPHEVDNQAFSELIISSNMALDHFLTDMYLNYSFCIRIGLQNAVILRSIAREKIAKAEAWLT